MNRSKEKNKSFISEKIIEIVGIVIAIAVISCACCFKDILNQNNNVITILVVSIGVASLGFSVFFTLRTNLLYHSRVADAYIYSHTLKAKKPGSIYREIARNWYWHAKRNREQAKVRACSANLCSYSIAILLLGIFFAIQLKPYVWLYPFGTSVVLIIIAFVISKRDKGYRFLSIAKWPIDPILPRWIEKGFIDNHDWLKTAVEWEDTIEKEDDC